MPAIAHLKAIEMRILQFNILDGCQGEPERLERLGHWLAAQPCDVVGLNELNGWDRLPQISQPDSLWGYPYHEIFVTRKSRHFVGALSRHPIERITSLEEGYHHGVLVLRIEGVQYIITHLTPKSSIERELEAENLVRLVRTIQAPVLLMGDLNTLSPLDREWHASTGLLPILRSDPALARKFLEEDMEINYRPMQKLLDAGLIDLCADGSRKASVPTASNRDAAHAANMRLDYIMANQRFLDERQPSATILQEDPLPTLSDHYPVTCEW